MGSEGETKGSYDFTITSAPGLRVFRKRLLINTEKQKEVIDVSDHVREFLKASGIRNGLISCYNRHTTSALVLSNRREGVTQTIGNIFSEYTKGDRMAGLLQEYKGDTQVLSAYLSSAILGNSVTLPIEEGTLLVGSWQGVFFIEMNGPREREVILTAVGS